MLHKSDFSQKVNRSIVVKNANESKNSNYVRERNSMFL